METIYHDECNCLSASNVRDDKCLKRYYFIEDIEKQDYKYIAICNSYLRLLFHNEKKRITSTTYLNCSGNRIMKNIETELISKYVEIKRPHYNYWFYDKPDLIDRAVRFIVCERPFISTTYTVKECVTHIIENEERNYKIEGALYPKIRDYLSVMKYKKWKTKYKQCVILTKQIEKTWNKNKKTILLNELFININEMNIKNKEKRPMRRLKTKY